MRVNAMCMHVSTTQDGGRDYFIKGWQHRNRAFDGDLVAVQVLPPECWIVSPYDISM